MAILNKIRQRSLVLILVIALALFSFVIGDLFKNSDALTGSSQDVVALVNGQEINRLDFLQQVKNFQERSGGRQTETQSKNIIYNQEVRKIVLETEYDALGLSVEKDEMRDLLKNSFSSYPEFQDENSNFSVAKLNAFIANLKELNGQSAPLSNFMVNYSSWTNNERNIETNALQQSYYNLIKAGVGATVAEAEDNYMAESETIDLKFVNIPYTSIPDADVEVTKGDIKAYIKAHENEYKVDASRELMYVEFEERASKADEDAIKAGLLELVNNKVEYNPNSKNNDTIPGFNTTTNISDFVNTYSDVKYDDTYLRASQLPAVAKDDIIALAKGANFGPYKDGDMYKLTKLIDTKQLPDSVKVRHILIPYVGGQRAGADVTQTPEDAKKTADSILTVLKANRSKFVDLLELSSDKVSNEKGGEIEFAYNSPFAPEFKAFSFDNTKGDIDVVGTSFGYHVIEILDQNNFSDTYKVATLADKIEPSDETLQEVFNKMSKFEIAVKDADFKAIAKERDLNVKPIEFKALDENIPGLGSQREIVRWAFNEDTDLGEYKNFPISGFGFIVAKLVEKKPEGLMSVEDASATVLPKIRNEKKAELIKEKITSNNLADIAKNQSVSVLTAKAVTMSNTTLSGAGVEPKVVGAAFGLDENTISQPIDGNKGIFVVEVTKINKATALDTYVAMQNRLSNTVKNSVQSKVYQALEKSAEIEDYRAKTVY